MTGAPGMPERNWAAITIISNETLPPGRPISLHITREPCHFEGEDSAVINIRISNELSALASTEKPT